MTGDPLAHLIVACRGRSDECDRPPATCSQLFREAAFSAASASDDEYQPWDSCFLCRYYGLLLSMNQGPIMNFTKHHRSCPVGAQFIGAPPIYRPGERIDGPLADNEF